MQRVYTLVERIADTPMTVLILGETGVGKEARRRGDPHAARAGATSPLIKLNCAALPETLLESELFGYERGAFTGADQRKVGFFEAADGGTLFLDEIGDMPLALQAKLLRVLERKVITRVGGTTEIATDARLIAATHRDLDAEVRAGPVPPGSAVPDRWLHDRRAPAARSAARDRPARRALRADRPPSSRAARPRRSPTTRARPSPATPGPATCASSRTRSSARSSCAATRSRRSISPTSCATPASATARSRSSADVRGQLAEVERAAIVAALEAEDNNQTRAARRLGLSRRALIYKMEKYGLKPPPSRQDS